MTTTKISKKKAEANGMITIFNETQQKSHQCRHPQWPTNWH